MHQNSDFLNFKEGLEKHIQLRFHSLLVQCEASELVVTNTLRTLKFRDAKGIHDLQFEPFEIKLRINRPLQQGQILQLAILSWWCPPLTQFELQESLRKECTSNLSIFDYQIYLESKELCLAALFLETHVSKRTLFGNILTGKYRVRQRVPGEKTITFLKNLKVQLEIELYREPRKKVYRRGYNDHGSLPPTDTVGIRKLNEEISTSLHLELEKKRLEARINHLRLKYKVEEFLGTG